MFLPVVSALTVILTAIAQGLTEGVIHLSGSVLPGGSDGTKLFRTHCVHIGVQVGSILSCFAVASIHSRVRLLQAIGCLALIGRGVVLVALPLVDVTGPTAHALACVIGACQSIVTIAIYSRSNEAVFSSAPHIVIYLFDAFSSLGQLLSATVVHIQRPDDRSLLVIGGGATLAIAAIFAVVLIFSAASIPVSSTASKCRVVLAAIGVFSATAITSFALRNIPQVVTADNTDLRIDETTGYHLIGLFHISFTISRFAAIFLSFRVSSCVLWFYSTLFTIGSILLLNVNAHCGSTIAVLLFGCFVGPIGPAAIGSLTTSGPLSPLSVTILVFVGHMAECTRLLRTDAIHTVLLGLALLCLGASALKRLGSTCTWRPDTVIKMIP